MLAATFALALAPVANADTNATWLMRWFDAALETGRAALVHNATPHDPTALLDAAKSVSRRPGETVLAASPSSAGHWTFVNDAGERFTAATDAEIKRAFDVLAPDALRRNMTLVVPPNAVFNHAKGLRSLPERAEIRVVTRFGPVPLVAVSDPLGSGTQVFAVALRERVLVPLRDAALFDETTWLLGRRFRSESLTVLSLTRRTPRAADQPIRSQSTKAVAGQMVAGRRVAEAMPALERRVVILTGRLDGDTLTFRTATGVAESVDLRAVRTAAAANDVQLILLDAPTARQPGVRNWLWQRATVDRLDTAVSKATFADFLAEVAPEGDKFLVEAQPAGASRMVLSAQSLNGPSAALDGGLVSGWIGEIITETWGTVATRSVQVALPNKARQRELDLRILPGVPSVLQLAYILSMLLGVIGWSFSRAWWARIWPAETRADYGSFIGHAAARVVRFLVFLIVFLPLVGLPAAALTIAARVASLLTWPFRRTVPQGWRGR